MQEVSVEASSVAIMAGDGTLQMFPLNFQRVQQQYESNVRKTSSVFQLQRNKFETLLPDNKCIDAIVTNFAYFSGVLPFVSVIHEGGLNWQNIFPCRPDVIWYKRVVLVYAMEVMWKSRGVAPLVPILGTRCR